MGDFGHARVQFDRAGAVALLPRNGGRVDVQVIAPDDVDALELVGAVAPLGVSSALAQLMPFACAGAGHS